MQRVQDGLKVVGRGRGIEARADEIESGAGEWEQNVGAESGSRGVLI